VPITKELIKEYKKDRSVYFETGSYKGDGVQKALDTGFNIVYSVEIEAQKYKDCVKRFKNHKENVFLKFSSSEDFLESIVTDKEHPLNNESCFIYLDAHPMGNNSKKVPLVAELKAIAKLKRNDHTIVVDDFRLIRDALGWGQQFKGKNMRVEFNKLFLAINKDYQISYHGDAWDDEDLIVATLEL
jgi:hypothetical protein